MKTKEEIEERLNKLGKFYEEDKTKLNPYTSINKAFYNVAELNEKIKILKWVLGIEE